MYRTIWICRRISILFQDHLPRMRSITSMCFSNSSTSVPNLQVTLNFFPMKLFTFTWLMLSVSADWSTERDIQVSCTPYKILAMLHDYSTWNRWDPDLDYATLTSASSATLGETGTVHMKDGSSHDFTVNNDVDGYYSYVTPIYGCDLNWYWDYSKRSADGQILFVEGLKAEGFTCFALKYVAEKKANEAFEKALINFKEICEQKVFGFQKIYSS
ncbi:hypothetical protein BC833DRAFT_608269 [Globomyces pollinis-pini]|nr:hypothetical protein BC833DRAFT_608269 [Globomyces pollinis-pini]